MAGIGWTRQAFAVHHWSAVPEVMTTGKGASGGYAPLAAMSVRGPLFQSIVQGSGGFTYGGRPPTAAVGAAEMPPSHVG